MAVQGRIYEEFEPTIERVTDSEADILILQLPDFKKDQLRVQLSTFRVLKISGERPLGGNKYQRFHKEVSVPITCDAIKISAKFQDGRLYVRQPKIIPAEQQPKPVPADEPTKQATAQPQVPATRPASAVIPPTQTEKKFSGETNEQGLKRIHASTTAVMGNEKEIFGGVFKQMKKPENMKKLIVSVVLVLALAFYTTYVKNYACKKVGEYDL